MHFLKLLFYPQAGNGLHSHSSRIAYFHKLTTVLPTTINNKLSPTKHIEINSPTWPSETLNLAMEG